VHAQKNQFVEINIMKKPSFLLLIFFLCYMMLAQSAMAEPTSGWVKVNTVRPYVDAGTAGFVFFDVLPSTGLCAPGGTHWYIDPRNGSYPVA
jgi:hypothetical protein